MAQQTLFLIRHAEKPEDGQPGGVAMDGTADHRSLTPKGWQRAGCWVELFAPSLGERSVLPPPQAIFASAPASGHDVGSDGVGSRSRRPMETVSTLAGKLHVAVDLQFSKGQEVALARVLSGIQGTTLVCWQHEDIAAIASALSPRPAQFPRDWPPHRFNIVLRFVRDGGANAPWSFDQLVPLMFKDDSSSTI
jgi:broad specificity phosphatase PhoE